jgi:UDP-glucose 6-dehydrogenase
MDNRISKYGASLHGRPFGGFCLPKDLIQLINLSTKLEIPPKLLKSVNEINLDMELLIKTKKY